MIATPDETLGMKASVVSLVKNDKRHLAFEILDLWFAKATRLEDYDLVGELSLKCDYRSLYLKCAEESYALSFHPTQKQAARLNLIQAYNMLNQPEKALFHVNNQLLLTPNNFDVLCHQAANLSLMGLKDQAEKKLEQLVNQYPDKAVQLESLLAGKYLRQGLLRRGLESFLETFKESNTLFDKRLKMRRWDGIPRPGRTVYVDSEGGIGDEIINIRFFAHVKRLGMNPVLCSPNNKYHKHKNELFRRHGIEVITESYSIDTSQYWIPMMSLPAVLNLKEENLWSGPYLQPVQSITQRINSSKIKVGIKCSGNPYFAQDEYRKIPLDLFVSYLPANADLYYIDVEPVQHPKVNNTNHLINSWDDTLDVVSQMDIIVSSCTSLVHASGAIGKPTIVAVPIAEYYVWTSSRTDDTTPWYGNNFRIVRQSKVRDWHHPLSELSEKIHTLIGKA